MQVFTLGKPSCEHLHERIIPLRGNVCTDKISLITSFNFTLKCLYQLIVRNHVHVC